MISNILDHQGQNQNEQESIIHIFNEYLDLKYCNIQSEICRYKNLISSGITQIPIEGKEI